MSVANGQRAGGSCDGSSTTKCLRASLCSCLPIITYLHSAFKTLTSTVALTMPQNVSLSCSFFWLIARQGEATVACRSSYVFYWASYMYLAGGRGFS